jgi:2-polyprenyl-3-methyl-5-hydroxy-6-metoxy-1,4-benzoquinol methylase
MQERHFNRDQYFKEQGLVTERYVLPFINGVQAISPSIIIAEIGCGEAGNLKPFLDLGCKAVGIDFSKAKIENGAKFYENHPHKENLNLINENIYDLSPVSIGRFDLIFMRDTLEHIHDQDAFLVHLKQFLKPNGIIFLSFPPWRMPFGGHQQVCESKFLSKLPYFHLLPITLYKLVLRIFGETPSKIIALLEVKETGISIRRFKKIIAKNNYRIEKENLYLINPNYEIKFKLKLRKLPRILNIPFIHDFFTTTCYYIVKIK